ncbi:hypothetical protein NDU88_001036 [Pleurodeles waltl]|uniref:Uncharacterized protein n=1 Tax=Pleurodeles waltl TaxID=8319 RepID=A0AAV7LBY8_PLEWA|nr:hypothetical protein NDU88_001036 [Pleurodeles waltl]
MDTPANTGVLLDFMGQTALIYAIVKTEQAVMQLLDNASVIQATMAAIVKKFAILECLEKNVRIPATVKKQLTVTI